MSLSKKVLYLLDILKNKNPFLLGTQGFAWPTQILPPQYGSEESCVFVEHDEKIITVIEVELCEGIKMLKQVSGNNRILLGWNDQYISLQFVG